MKCRNKTPHDNAANIVTLTRIAASAALFPIKCGTVQLCIVYAYCGLSDMIDDMIARELHTESERGAILDNMSDLCFAASYAANVLPKLQFDNWVI